MKISLIVAMASNRIIGANKQMPWHLSADLKRFKAITLGAPILMGRNTYEAIGRPLPGRTNIVVSSNANYQAAGCLVFQDPDAALAFACTTAEEIFIIGGATLYERFLPQADTLYITEINKEFSGDTAFPEWPTADWLEQQREYINDDASVDFTYSFLKYIRR